LPSTIVQPVLFGCFVWVFIITNANTTINANDLIILNTKSSRCQSARPYLPQRQIRLSLSYGATLLFSKNLPGRLFSVCKCGYGSIEYAVSALSELLLDDDGWRKRPSRKRELGNEMSADSNTYKREGSTVTFSGGSTNTTIDEPATDARQRLDQEARSPHEKYRQTLQCRTYHSTGRLYTTCDPASVFEFAAHHAGPAPPRRSLSCI
jgi:hypothetical protein